MNVNMNIKLELGYWLVGDDEDTFVICGNQEDGYEVGYEGGDIMLYESNDFETCLTYCWNSL